MRTHQLEGRKREERVIELGNMAHHKQQLTCWREERGRNRLVSLETWHNTNEDSPTGGEEEGGVGWSPLVSLETWHIKNENSPTGGEEQGGAVIR